MACDGEIINQAIASRFRDFKDAVQYMSATIGNTRKAINTWINSFLETVVQTDAPNARKVEILNSVKGVGPVTASSLVAELLTILNTLVKSNQQWRVPTQCHVK